MNRLHSVRSAFAITSLLAIVGCAPSKEEMAAMMRQPPRPPALDQLDQFVGNWTATAKVKMKDEVKESTGRNSTEWDLERRVLVEHWEHEMDSPENVMKGISLMWFDSSARKYRMTSADNYGGRGEGVMTYDEKLGKWSMSGTSWDQAGHKSVWSGTCTRVDDRTMQWDFTESMPMSLGLVKFVEVSGTSKKQ